MDKEAFREMLISRLVGKDIQDLRDMFVSGDYTLGVNMLRNGIDGYEDFSTKLLEDIARKKGLIE